MEQIRKTKRKLVDIKHRLLGAFYPKIQVEIPEDVEIKIEEDLNGSNPSIKIKLFKRRKKETKEDIWKDYAENRTIL